jgi:5-oxoprolinase (ATP-hydrolysing)
MAQRHRVYTRDQLSPGHKVKGPAIIIEPHQTVVVEPGWQAAITAKNHLVLTRIVRLRRTSAIGTKADPIMLEVFNNLFMSIAEQMGVALQNTAYSVNIKERLDFSCAVFAHDGTLVANAPHMPVHLASWTARSRRSFVTSGAGSTRRRLRDQRAPPMAARISGYHRRTRSSTTRRHPVLGRLRPYADVRDPAWLDVAERGRSKRKACRSIIASRSGPFPRKGILCRVSAKYPARNPLQNVNDMKAQMPTRRACTNCARWSRISRCRS